MRKNSLILVLIASLLVSGCVTVSKQYIKPKAKFSSLESTGDVDWWVVNNFRLLDGEEEEIRFKRDLAMFLEAAKIWSNREKNSRIGPNILYEDLVQHEHYSVYPIGGDGADTHAKIGHANDAGKLLRSEYSAVKNPVSGISKDEVEAIYEERNYSVNYDSTFQSYGSKDDPDGWVYNKTRTVRLNWRSQPLKDMCQIDVLSSDGAVSDPGGKFFCTTGDVSANELSCISNAACINLDTDKAYKIRITNLSTQEIEVVDIKIEDKVFVALGDSFSAGEGNPHMQYRLIGNVHPSAWLDPRCNRSLLSGPSLASVFYAQKHPQESVTLLHYGCSGASINDGVIRPWSLVETSEQAQHTQDHPIYIGYSANEPHEENQYSHCVGSTKEGLISRRECKSASNEYADLLPSQVSLARNDLSVDKDFSLTPSLADFKPDYVIISAGGNDVGFASFVQGIMLPLIRPDLLKPQGCEDPNDDACYKRPPYLRLDDAEWYEVAPHADLLIQRLMREGQFRSICNDKADVMPTIECAASAILYNELNGSRVPESRQRRAYLIAAAMMRIEKMIGDQYDALYTAVEEHLKPDNVLVTLYPSPIMYRSDNTKLERDDAEQACNDTAFDRRAGLVPGIFEWIPGVGAGKDDIWAANRYILNKLNSDIEAATDELAVQNSRWDVVDRESFTDLTMPFGYCSRDGKFINTVADALFLQSVPGASDGFSIGHLNYDGEDYVWDMASKTYIGTGDDASIPPLDSQWVRQTLSAEGVKFPSSAETPSNALPNLEIKSAKKPAKVAKKRQIQTGIFHPTVLGHCAYALSILDKIDGSESQLEGREDLWKGDTGKDLIFDLCSANTLGWSYEETH